MKESMLKSASIGALALALAVLAGCGGGGSNGSDATGGSASTTPAPPVAVNQAPVPRLALSGQATTISATGDAATFTGVDVRLDASASSDPEGDALTFVWTLANKPAGSMAAVKGSGTAVTLTPDVAGTYAVNVRITDSKGAFTDKQAGVVVAANAAPVAAFDASRLSVAVGTAANLQAGHSSDGDGDQLTYAWHLDSAPAGSTAKVAGAAAQVAFTPDVAGTYLVSVTVSDGKASSTAQAAVAALAASATTTRLPFAPLVSHYSRGLDLFVSVSAGPDLLNIVDPFTGAVRQVPLPAAVKDMTLSPDGKLAVVLHAGVISVVDVEHAVLLRSSVTGGTQSVAFITNVGLVYLMGQPDNATNGRLVSVIDGKTGVDMTSTLSASFGGTSTYAAGLGGVYSGIRHKAYVSRTDLQTEIVSFSIGADNVASVPVSTGYRLDYYSPLNFFLNQNEDTLFARNGNFFSADTLKYQGTLTLSLHFIGSLSQSNTADETVLLLYGVRRQDSTGLYLPQYEPVFQRFTGPQYAVAADVDLPVIDGLQSYGIGIYHSANSNRIVLVQAGSDISFDQGLPYYLVVK